MDTTKVSVSIFRAAIHVLSNVLTRWRAGVCLTKAAAQLLFLAYAALAILNYV
jgi:hypothetical protein